MQIGVLVRAQNKSLRLLLQLIFLHQIKKVLNSGVMGLLLPIFLVHALVLEGILFHADIQKLLFVDGNVLRAQPIEEFIESIFSQTLRQDAYLLLNLLSLQRLVHF